MNHLIIAVLIFGTISHLFSCTFKFKNDGAKDIFIVQEEEGKNPREHFIKAGETKTIPGAAADTFDVYTNLVAQDFTHEFNVAETDCALPKQPEALITYTQLQAAIAQNERDLSFPGTAQTFFVHTGTGKNMPVSAAKP